MENIFFSIFRNFGEKMETYCRTKSKNTKFQKTYFLLKLFLKKLLILIFLFSGMSIKKKSYPQTKNLLKARYIKLHIEIINQIDLIFPKVNSISDKLPLKKITYPDQTEDSKLSSASICNFFSQTHNKFRGKRYFNGFCPIFEMWKYEKNKFYKDIFCENFCQHQNRRLSPYKITGTVIKYFI